MCHVALRCAALCCVVPRCAVLDSVFPVVPQSLCASFVLQRRQVSSADSVTAAAGVSCGRKVTAAMCALCYVL